MEELRRLTIERLNRLVDSNKQIAFAYSACARMLPNYQYFARNYGWGNEYCLIEALDLIRGFILGHPLQSQNAKLLSMIYTSIPDSGEFSNSFSTYAQNAASSIYYTLNSVVKINVDELSWALVLSRDTVDAFVQESEGLEYDNEFEHKIRNHRLMQRELRKQELDFSLILPQKQIYEETLESLTNFNNGRSNIDVSIYDTN